MMNCEKAAQLIPLYVENDLESDDLQAVGYHLDACEACNKLAAEFQASQLWLRTAAAPAFDEAICADVRRAVQQTVAQTTTRPALAEFLSPLWNWQFGLLTATALLLLASGIVLTSRLAAGKKQPTAAVAQPIVTATKSVAALPATEKHLSAAKPVQSRMGQKKTTSPSKGRDDERSPEFATLEIPSPAKEVALITGVVAPLSTNDSAASNPNADLLSLLSAASAENAAPLNAEKAAPEPEMLRMEIQTADPNVRIIWLTPKEPPARVNAAAEPK